MSDKIPLFSQNLLKRLSAFSNDSSSRTLTPVKYLDLPSKSKKGIKLHTSYRILIYSAQRNCQAKVSKKASIQVNIAGISKMDYQDFAPRTSSIGLAEKPWTSSSLRARCQGLLFDVFVLCSAWTPESSLRRHSGMVLFRG
ncbi:MAG: hypothetical protein ABIK83_12120, partial [Candidatus Zixiibacteriota bacterium]